MNKENDPQSMSVFRIRNKHTKQFISDGKHSHKNSKRFYYSLGAAKAALKQLYSGNVSPCITANGIIYKSQYDPKDYEIVEFDLIEKHVCTA